MRDLRRHALVWSWGECRSFIMLDGVSLTYGQPLMVRNPAPALRDHRVRAARRNCLAWRFFLDSLHFIDDGSRCCQEILYYYRRTDELTHRTSLPRICCTTALSLRLKCGHARTPSPPYDACHALLLLTKNVSDEIRYERRTRTATGLRNERTSRAREGVAYR